MSKFTQRAIDKLNKNLNPHLTQLAYINVNMTTVEEVTTYTVTSTLDEFNAVLADPSKPLFLRVTGGTTIPYYYIPAHRGTTSIIATDQGMNYEESAITALWVEYYTISVSSGSLVCTVTAATKSFT